MNSEHVAVRYVDAPLVDDAWVDVNVALSFSLVVVEWLFSTFIDVAFVDVVIVDVTSVDLHLLNVSVAGMPVVDDSFVVMCLPLVCVDARFHFSMLYLQT